MSGVSARDYGGGLTAQASGPAGFTRDFGEPLDEEVAKKVGPEKGHQEEKDAEMKRLKQLRQHEHNDFEAAQAEADKQRASAKAAAAKASALASAGAASAAAKKRALPKMLQIKRKDAGAEDEAASAKR